MLKIARMKFNLMCENVCLCMPLQVNSDQIGVGIPKFRCWTTKDKMSTRHGSANLCHRQADTVQVD